MKDEDVKKGLVVSISVVTKMNPIETKVETLFFADVEEGREFAKNHTTISKQLVTIAK